MALCGGLVEIVRSADDVEYVQFMHQTVKDFVEHQQFRSSVLDGVHASLIVENGHSFISKHALLVQRLQPNSFFHLRQAERTTGLSQYFIMSKLNSKHWEILCHSIQLHMRWTLVQFAVFAGLQICLNDVHKRDKKLIASSSEPLINLLFHSTREAPLQTYNDVARTIIEKGFKVEQDFAGLKKIVTYAVPKDMGRDASLRYYEILACTLLQGNSNLNNIPVELLHQGTAPVIELLIARGADVNALDEIGNTPLDTVVEARSASLGSITHYRYNSACVLVSHGGRLGTTTGNKSSRWLREVQNQGFDITTFDEARMPQWNRQRMLQGHGARMKRAFQSIAHRSKSPR
jgi:hypothetical protein